MARISYTNDVFYSPLPEYGDAETLGKGETGGNDLFYGSYDTDIVGAGDAYALTVDARGGQDTFYGGLGGHNVFAGDASWEMTGSSRGGADRFFGGAQAFNLFVGDADTMVDDTKGGNDVFVGGAGSGSTAGNPGNIAAGDAYVMQGEAAGGDDMLTGGSDSFNLLLGEAEVMSESAVGGGDRIVGGDAIGDYLPEEVDPGSFAPYALNLLLGEAGSMDTGTRGGADQLTGGSARGVDTDVFNLMSGDAVNLAGGVVAGNDVLTGGGAFALGSGVTNFMAGDGYIMEPPDGLGLVTVFGKDTLTGGSGMDESVEGVQNILFGDLGFLALPDQSPYPNSGVMYGAVKGGDDILYGGKNLAGNYLFGDAVSLEQGARGGDDLLVAGDAATMSVLVGDAQYIAEGARGGNDRLISGAANDWMYGDAWDFNAGLGGADRFVFSPGNGLDRILDFDASQGDKIDLKAFKGLNVDFNGDGIRDFQNFSALMASGRVTLADADGDSMVDDIVINTQVGDASGFEIVLVGNFEMTDISQGWFSI